ncbi:hypothetical protein SANTM175S_01507 [Streptomyces antimycoticus]
MWRRVRSPSPSGVTRSTARSRGSPAGIEIPELLGKGKTAKQDEERREAEEKAAAEEEAAAEARAAEEAEAKAAAGGKQRGALRRVLLGPGKAADQPTGGGGGGVATWLAGLGPVLLVAVGLLVAGAVMGNIIPIAFGWVIAYSGTYRHSPAGAKWASLGIPGLVAAGAGVWLWGRAARKWGQPIPRTGGRTRSPAPGRSSSGARPSPRCSSCCGARGGARAEAGGGAPGPPLSPARPAPLSPARPAPLSPARPAPLSPARPAPLSPARPAPLSPARPAPLSPARPAPLRPARPGRRSRGRYGGPRGRRRRAAPRRRRRPR